MLFPKKRRVAWEELTFFAVVLSSLFFFVEKIVEPGPAHREREVASQSVSMAMAGGSLVKLGCLSRVGGRELFRSSDGYIRLQGKLCASEEVLEELSVRNLDNGYEGTVLLHGDRFSTDYLLLGKGVNRVEIRWSVGGKTHTRLERVRR